MNDTERGWQRAGIHFFGFGIAMHTISGISYWLGIEMGWMPIVAIPILGLTFAIIMTKELTELALGRQDIYKTFIDIFAMTAGTFIGLLTWMGWWV